MSNCIEYADNAYNELSSEIVQPSVFTRKVDENIVRYRLSGTVNSKHVSLVYMIAPYADKEGGDAALYSPEYRDINIRFEQEMTTLDLNKDTDIAFCYFSHAIKGQLNVVATKFLWLQGHRLEPTVPNPMLFNERNFMTERLTRVVSRNIFLLNE